MIDATLHRGPWQEALANTGEVDVMLTDPPYSARTEDGARSQNNGNPAANIHYGHITEADARQLAEVWSPRVRRWVIIFCDHVAWRWHEQAWRDAGWLTFAPVVWVKRGAPPRFQADGPASQVEWMMVARPKGAGFRIGHKPGWYMAHTVRGAMQGKGDNKVAGTKDVDALARILVDYTRPGELVADPYAGTATVGAACVRTGRRYVGSEVDEYRHGLGISRLEKTKTDPVVLDRWGEARKQRELFG